MFVEDIKMLLVKRGLKQYELAERLGESAPNYSMKLKRNTLKDTDIKQSLLALGCTVEFIYRDAETGDVLLKSKL